MYWDKVYLRDVRDRRDRGGLPDCGAPLAAAKRREPLPRSRREQRHGVGERGGWRGENVQI